MTPYEMLNVLDAAIVGPKAKGGSVLELRSPTVLGQTGKYIGRDPGDGAAVYGFTRRQCKLMKKVILDAARADLAGDVDG